MQISVVLPAYNEVKRLPKTLDRVLAYLKANFESWEIIVADDGSKDATVESLASKYPEVQFLRDPINKGKGQTVKRGVMAAQGEWILFSDSDLSTPIEELGPMLEAAKKDALDVVIASRAIEGAVLVVHQPWWREIAGRTFNFLVRMFSGLPYRDTQCGFKLFSHGAAQQLFSIADSNGWAFDVELLMIAQMLSLKVREVPVHWIHDEGSKVRMHIAAPKMTLDVITFRWRRFSGAYARRAQPARETHAAH